MPETVVLDATRADKIINRLENDVIPWLEASLSPNSPLPTCSRAWGASKAAARSIRPTACIRTAARCFAMPWPRDASYAILVST